MNLSMKNNTENDDTENIVPLGNNDIKSVLQKKSESVFEEKNISSKTDFIKKSLIEIALDFETKTKKDDNNDFIYIGCQILSRSLFAKYKVHRFSITEIWNELLKKDKLNGFESSSKFYHLTNLETFKKLKDL